jgi:transcriptional regulator with XRE-family HTH domain
VTGARVADVPTAYGTLGEIIRRQRELSAMPVRQFAAMVGISAPYLSQIERGLRAPSDAVLETIAQSLQTTADALYAEAGYEPPADDSEADRADPPVLAAVRADDDLTPAQRRAIEEIYQAFRDANAVRRRRTKGARGAT